MQRSEFILTFSIMEQLKIIGYTSDSVVSFFHIKKRKKMKKKPNLANTRCCYCEVFLNKQTFTREHVIPKHIGGKMILPCCITCNREKGGLMLFKYRAFLENQLKKNIVEWEQTLLKTKLKNVIKIQNRL